MTEEEAMTKVCCGPEGCGNTHDPIPQAGYFKDGTKYPRTCIGSRCMAWRSRPGFDLSNVRAFVAQEQKVSAIKALREVCPDYGLLEAKEVIEGKRPWPISVPDGFCGLAGAPT